MRRKMCWKKWVIGFLALSMLTLLMSVPGSCAKVIRYWTTESDPMSIEIDFGIIRDFEEQNPDVRIKPEYISESDLFPKLMASMRAGTEPEVMYGAPWLVQSMGAKGSLVPLDDVVARLERSKFIPELLDSMVVKGRVIGIPVQTCTFQLFYRKDILSEKGLVPPLYRHELIALAEKLTEDVNGDGQVDRWGYTQGGKGFFAQETFFSELWCNGGYLFDRGNNVVFDTTYFEESVDALDYLKELAEFCPPGMIAYGFSEMNLAYINDKAVMCRSAGRMISQIERYNSDIGFVTNAVPSPMDEDKKILISWSGADCWAMFDGCRYPDEGKDFIHHYMSGDNYVNFLRGVPLHLFPSYDVEKYSSMLQEFPMWKKYAQVWDVMVEMMSTPGVPRGANFEHRGVFNPYMGDVYGLGVIGDKMNEFFAGKISAEEVVRQAGVAWRQTVQEMKEKGI